jgi:hypothetical protein
VTLDESVRAKERELSLRSLQRLAEADARLTADVTSILGMSEYERRRFHNAQQARDARQSRLWQWATLALLTAAFVLVWVFVWG